MTAEAAVDHSVDRAVDAGRQELLAAWADRHGVGAARRLAAAEDVADAIGEEITPANTRDTYTKSWTVWQRYVREAGLPETEATRGALVSYAAWLLRQGQTTGSGYAPASAQLHLAGAVVGLRERGVEVSRDVQAEARAALDGLTVRLLQDGQRRGRGQATTATVAGLRDVVAACPDTLAGWRDRALVLTGWHYAGHAAEAAGLLAGDLQFVPDRGLVVRVLTGKTAHRVRDAKVPYATDPALCPVRAWLDYRHQLTIQAPEWDRPNAPAYVGIDRWGTVSGGLTPDSVTRAIRRASQRAGVPAAWTGHSLRIGLASTARQAGRDAVAIADQGGWARHSRSMLGYMQIEDGWDDHATTGLT